MAGQPGVGKTALLCHAALDALLRGQQVLHLTIAESVNHVRAHYDEVLRVVGADDASKLQVERGRVIHSGRSADFDAAMLGRHLDMLADAAEFVPEAVIVDGLQGKDLQSALPDLSRLAHDRSLRCWVDVRSEAPVPSEIFGHVQLVLRLVHDGDVLRLRAVHGGDSASPQILDPATLLESYDAAPSEVDPAGQLRPEDCTLFSGGAAGSEAAFGEAAERRGVQEVAFTFEGHLQSRTVGRRELSPQELAMGDVSLTYVSKQLNRSYNDAGGLIRGVLQTLWHMVRRSQQVFVVGTIQQDGTVRGGTGWSVELARMWSRELWVFDEPRATWHQWHAEQGWTPGVPKIHAAHICGTGTRQITDAGRRAIDALFAESFGP